MVRVEIHMMMDNENRNISSLFFEESFLVVVCSRSVFKTFSLVAKSFYKVKDKFFVRLEALVFVLL